MAITSNLCIRRATGATINVAIAGDGDQPFDLSGAQVFYWVSKTWHSTSSLIEKDLSNGIAVVPGGVKITLTASDTDLAVRTFYHQLVVDIGDAKYTALTGVLKIRPSLRTDPHFAFPAAAQLVLDGKLSAVAH